MNNTSARANGQRSNAELSPPHDLVAEGIVIAVALRSEEQRAAILKEVDPGTFYGVAHKMIFDAMGALHFSGAPSDAPAVYQLIVERKQQQDVGAHYIGQLWTDYAKKGESLEKWRHYTAIIREKADARRTIYLLNESLRDCYSPVGPMDELRAGLIDNLGRHARTEKSQFEFLSDDDFSTGDFRPNWIVKGVLVQGEPAVIAAPVKSLKTSVAVDLGISISSGHPFLGKFEVPVPLRVAIVSGESGRSTLQQMRRRILEAKGINSPGHLHWLFNVPILSDLAAMADFVARLEALKIDIVILDPLYLMLGPVDVKNMFETGPVLSNVSRMLLAKGITPILIHHANRQLPAGEVMELQHLSYSGCDQFMRQFILLSRREKYLSDGNHKLWMRVGGSAGHGGLYGLDVEEGELDNETFGGRTWNVLVQPAADLQGDDAREEKKVAKAVEQDKKAVAKVLAGIDSERSAGQPGATKNAIKEHGGFQSAALTEAIDRLLELGRIEEIPFLKSMGKNAKKSVIGYRRTSTDHAGESIFPHDIPALPHDPGSGEGTCGDHAGEVSPLKGDTPALPHDPEPRDPEPPTVPKSPTEPTFTEADYRTLNSW